MGLHDTDRSHEVVNRFEMTAELFNFNLNGLFGVELLVLSLET